MATGVLTIIAPAVGPVRGGDLVRFVGSSLADAVRVSFGGVVAHVESIRREGGADILEVRTPQQIHRHRHRPRPTPEDFHERFHKQHERPMPRLCASPRPRLRGPGSLPLPAPAEPRRAPRGNLLDPRRKGSNISGSCKFPTREPPHPTPSASHTAGDPILWMRSRQEGWGGGLGPRRDRWNSYRARPGIRPRVAWTETR